jgi:hypothetical protein
MTTPMRTETSTRIRTSMRAVTWRLSVRGKRVGRIAAGAVLITGAAWLVYLLAEVHRPRVAYTIPAIWAAAAAIYLLGAALGSRRTLDHSGELAVSALVVPAVGAALMLPLTLHLLVGVVISSTPRGFDEWAGLSVLFTGPTHLVLAALVARRARQLATGLPAISPAKIYGICVAVSCLPFAIFVLPPFLVGLTGLPLAALMSLMAPLAERDRRAAADEALPRAAVVRSAD